MSTIKETYKKILENAKDRDSERVVSLKKNQSPDHLFLLSSSDIGTLRNMGRRGSLYAPRAIMNVLTKLSEHNQKSFNEYEVSSIHLESENFDLAQQKEKEKIQNLLKTHPQTNLIHLGGGHDHIYPLCMALNDQITNLTVINIDAHLDTRTDSLFHSGTPFRQIAKEFKGDFHLIQIGIHDFANTKSTMSPLSKGKETIYFYDNVKKETNHFTNNHDFFKKIFNDKYTTYLVSLDADALSSSVMEGVSAVNHRGLSYDFVEELFVFAKKELKSMYFGIYEYNPIYDNLSQKGARALSSLIYEILEKKLSY